MSKQGQACEQVYILPEKHFPFTPLILRPFSLPLPMIAEMSLFAAILSIDMSGTSPKRVELFLLQNFARVLHFPTEQIL